MRPLGLLASTVAFAPSAWAVTVSGLIGVSWKSAGGGSLLRKLPLKPPLLKPVEALA